jgi:hypothetical protein
LSETELVEFNNLAQKGTVKTRSMKQAQIFEEKTPLPARPSQVERYDYAYQRNGTCNLFLFFEPECGWRPVDVTEQRSQVDFAHPMKWLVDMKYPDAEVMRVVLDLLNTRRAAALYEAFDPAEAGRILRRLEFLSTPKHGSWLNADNQY